MSEAREYLKAKGALQQKLIDLAYGRPYGSKPILVPLSKTLKVIDEAAKDFPDEDWMWFKEVNEDEELETNWEEYAKGVKEWFEKWFGSATIQKQEGRT